MNRPRDYCTRSKSKRERQIPYDITYMWNLKYDTNELIYEKEIDPQIENRLVVAKGKWGEGGLYWEFGTSKCKLFCIKWINNKVLLYSTGNYIQYPVMNHNGKDYEKEYIYICMCVCVYTSPGCRVCSFLFFSFFF